MSGVPGEISSLTIARYGRFWAVYDGSQSQTTEQEGGGQLVCLTVYRKGAREVVRRLQATVLPAETHSGANLIGDDDMKGTRDNGICQRADNRPRTDGLYGRQ